MLIFGLIFAFFDDFSVLLAQMGIEKTPSTWQVCLLFCENLDTLLAEMDFSLDLYAFVILKNLLTFSSFLVEVVCRIFLCIIWVQIFSKKFTSVVLVSTSCYWWSNFDRDSYFGIWICDKIWSDFLSYFNRFDFLVFDFFVL